MKLNALFLGLALLQPASAAVGNQDLQAIRQLINTGQYEEALQKHLWFHKESKSSPSMGAVRLSVALDQWADLSGKYPKALEAFKRLRDQHEQTLLAGAGGFPEFHEYASFNRTLKEDDKTYELFKRLHAAYPQTAAQCFHAAMNLIVARKDYELCGAYIKDALKLYEDSQKARDLNLNLAKSRPEFAYYADQAFDTKTSQLIEIMVNLNQHEVAKEIQKRAVSYFPDTVVRSLRLDAPAGEVAGQLESAKKAVTQRAAVQAQAPRPRYRAPGTTWPAGDRNALLGTWLNTDPQTRSIPKVDILQESGTLKIRFWGRTQPEDSPFGPPVELFVLSGLSDATVTNVPNATVVAFATHTVNFATKHFTLHLMDGDLHLQGVTIFTDNSKRDNRIYHAVFKKGPDTAKTDLPPAPPKPAGAVAVPPSAEIGMTFTSLAQVSSYFGQRGFVVTGKFENSRWPAKLVRLKEAMHEVSVTLKSGKFLNYSGPGFTGYRLRVATLEDADGGETVVILSSKELIKSK